MTTRKKWEREKISGKLEDFNAAQFYSSSFFFFFGMNLGYQETRSIKKGETKNAANIERSK